VGFIFVIINKLTQKGGYTSIWLLSNKRVLLFICVLTGLSYTLTFTGCATIMHGRYQDVAIASSPSGANARIDDMTVVTPATLNLKRIKLYHKC